MGTTERRGYYPAKSGDRCHKYRTKQGDYIFYSDRDGATCSGVVLTVRTEMVKVDFGGGLTKMVSMSKCVHQ